MNRLLVAVALLMPSALGCSGEAPLDGAAGQDMANEGNVSELKQAANNCREGTSCQIFKNPFVQSGILEATLVSGDAYCLEQGYLHFTFTATEGAFREDVLIHWNSDRGEWEHLTALGGEGIVTEIRCETRFVKIRRTSFDGDWFYTEWAQEHNVDTYTQFVIGSGPSGTKWLHRNNPGSDDRGNYLYQYYHRNELCAAFGAGTFSMYAQVMPFALRSGAGSSPITGSITCP